MLCIRSENAALISTCIPFSSSKHPTRHLLSFPSRSSIKAMSSLYKLDAIEHIVLFKVKENTEPSKITSMINGLNSLISLDNIYHLAVGPLLRNHSSSSLTFTHMLHSRYPSKEDLEAYSAHPSHVRVVNENVLPIVDDIMAVDWIAKDLTRGLSPSHGSAIRVTFLKLKENVVSDEVLEVIKEIPENFKQINQLTVGENFSPARAKGYSIASLAVFPGTSELEEVDSNHELVSYQKDNVRDRIDSVVIVDFVVPRPSVAKSFK